MNRARNYNVKRRYQANAVKSGTEAAVQQALVHYLESHADIVRVLTEVDRGNCITDVLALHSTAPSLPGDLISVFEVKINHDLKSAIRQAAKQSGHYRWIVIPKQRIRELIQRWCTFEGVGILFWIPGSNGSGTFETGITPIRQRMSRQAFERAKAHFEGHDKAER